MIWQKPKTLALSMLPTARTDVSAWGRGLLAEGGGQVRWKEEAAARSRGSSSLELTVIARQRGCSG